MKIGISSCLMGAMCRYDGAHSKDKFLVDVLQKYFEFVAFCPEKIIFGTPREAIRLVEIAGEIKVFTTNSNKEVTQELSDISKQNALKIQDDDLCGFILKSKSPTCGLERVKVYQHKNAPSEKKGIGLFAKEIKKLYPLLPIEEEGRLNDPWLRENFLMQILAYEDLHNFLNTKVTIKSLVDFHTSYKYLIYAKSQTSYKKLGNIVANQENKKLENILSEYKIAFLEAINEKSTIKKTYNVILHIFGYFKKHLTSEEKADMLESMDEFKNEIIPLIVVIKLLNLYTKKFDITYLKTQKFLNPYPKELSLRSDIKAFK